jgi:hypothetical protein
MNDLIKSRLITVFRNIPLLDSKVWLQRPPHVPAHSFQVWLLGLVKEANDEMAEMLMVEFSDNGAFIYRLSPEIPPPTQNGGLNN